MGIKSGTRYVQGLKERGSKTEAADDELSQESGPRIEIQVFGMSRHGSGLQQFQQCDQECRMSNGDINFHPNVSQ